jgi:lipoyl(octanoyl) transferase
MNPDPWYLLNSGLGAYDLNMALDEALLEAMPRLGRPVLRFYGWREAAASFGYFQRYSDVAALTSSRPLVRRPTGGGIVPHDADWTYSLAFPPTHQWYALTALQSYECVHQWIHDAFERLGLVTDLAAEPNKTQPGRCFAGFERFDLLCEGRKIAGAAQRRRRNGLLIQGSVQAPARAGPRAAWEQAMTETAKDRQDVRWTELVLEPRLVFLANHLASTKYSQPSYNRKR